EGPNIHFLGKRPYEQLPSYLRGIDVCIIPFEVNEITLSVDPIKIYEYLAAGKPVVSTFLPELQKFGDRVRIAKNREDFENQIREALREDGALVSKRIDLARSNTWEERARRISQIIDELLIAKRGTAG
ncbi:MAG: glycosyltransferase, partial [Thermoplasmata archaeon]